MCVNEMKERERESAARKEGGGDSLCVDVCGWCGVGACVEQCECHD